MKSNQDVTAGKDNSVNKLMDGFDADAVFVEYDPEYHMAACSPYNSKTGEHWIGMTLFTSPEEAVESDYEVCCNEDDEATRGIIEQIKSRMAEATDAN